MVSIEIRKRLQQRRIRRQQRMAAVNFLTNISLDGTRRNRNLDAISDPSRHQSTPTEQQANPVDAGDNAGDPGLDLNDRCTDNKKLETITQTSVLNDETTKSESDANKELGHQTAQSPTNNFGGRILDLGRRFRCHRLRTILMVPNRSLNFCFRRNRPHQDLTSTESSNERNTRYGFISASGQLSRITDCETFNLIAKHGLANIEEEFSFNNILAIGVKKFQPNSISEAIAYNNSILMNRAAGCSTDKPNQTESSVSSSAILTSDSVGENECNLHVSPDIQINIDDTTVNWTYFATATSGCLEKLVYHPNMLDDPELIAEKYGNQSIGASIINFLKPKDLNKELNDTFRERFPHIELKLSKLRSIKNEMCKIAFAEPDMDMDFQAIAEAHIFFEKLVFKSLITKQNRKLCAGACLMLSAKMNDSDIEKLVKKIVSVFRLNRKELLNTEYAVLVALEFDVTPPNWQTQLYYDRLISEY